MSDDRVYLVGGGGNGLGKVTAEHLGEEGASLVVSDLGTSVRGEGRDETVARAVADAISDRGGTAVAHAGDVSDPDAAADAVETAIDAYGRLDGVANFAGILRDGMSWELTEADWDAVTDAHLKSNFALLRAAIRHWRAADEGVDGRESGEATDAQGADGDAADRTYLAVSSWGAMGNVGQLNYASANAGVLGFVRAASTELHRQGVRVNGLVPNGYTRMTESVPEEYRPYTREEMPPERVAPVAAYLLGTESADVTGVTVTAADDAVGLLSDPTEEVVGIAETEWTADTLPDLFDRFGEDHDLQRTDRYL